MKLYRALTTAAASGALVLGLSGVAMADEVDVSNTGPGSTNTVTIDNNQSFTENNDQTVTVTNENTQTATTGDATVSNNTSGGNAVSGEATNTNSTETTVSFDGGRGEGGPVGGGTLPGGSSGGGGSTSGAGGPGGGVGGGSLQSMGGGVGGGVLPETGPESPMDVSLLRDAVGSSPAADLVKQTNRTSTLLLALGALLSLLGAVGAAVYANKQEAKVRG